MILMVSGATTTIEKYLNSKYLGAFRTPNTGNSISRIVEWELPWGCDNGCFDKRFNEKIFLNMLEKLSKEDTSRLKFVTCPDVVGNTEETYDLFTKWYPIIKSYNLPIAYAIQSPDALEVPWDKIDAVFLGGTDDWRYGTRIMKNIIHEAKKHGLWVHMGRINTLWGLKFTHEIGCDSVDGSKYSYYPQKHIPRALEFLHQLEEETENEK